MTWGGRPKFFVLALWGLLAVWATWAVPSRAAASPALPLNIPSPPWSPLDRIGDKRLQAGLEQTLKRRELWRSLVETKKMAVGLVDLSDPKAPRWARVNGQVMMYGASLPKLAILLAAFQSFQDGSLKETPAIRADLIEMMRRSDNEAAGRLTERIGLRKIESLLLGPRYRFYDARQGGGIWLGSGFTRGGERRPDPLQDLLHAATADQVCRFYYLLAYGRLVNPEASRQMLKILAFPDHHNKFIKVLEQTVPPQRLYRKYGEYGAHHSDSVLVWGDDWRRYILVGLVVHRQGERILEKLVPAAEALLRTGGQKKYPRQPPGFTK